MSAQRKQNLSMPSRRRITAFSDRNIECERCIGCDMREKQDAQRQGIQDDPEQGLQHSSCEGSSHR